MANQPRIIDIYMRKNKKANQPRIIEVYNTDKPRPQPSVFARDSPYVMGFVAMLACFLIGAMLMRTQGLWWAGVVLVAIPVIVVGLLGYFFIKKLYEKVKR